MVNKEMDFPIEYNHRHLHKWTLYFFVSSTKVDRLITWNPMKIAIFCFHHWISLEKVTILNMKLAVTEYYARILKHMICFVYCPKRAEKYKFPDNKNLGGTKFNYNGAEMGIIL